MASKGICCPFFSNDFGGASRLLQFLTKKGDAARFLDKTFGRTIRTRLNKLGDKHEEILPRFFKVIFVVAIRPLQILATNRRKCCPFFGLGIFRCLVTNRRRCCPFHSNIWDAIRPSKICLQTRGNARFSRRVIGCSSVFQHLVTSWRKCCQSFSHFI